MAWWKREKRATEPVEERQTFEDIFLQAGYNLETLTVTQAMAIPSFAASVNLISNTVASLPIRLYKKTGDKTEVVDNDNRVKLLNLETGDTLDSFQWKKSMVTDYLIYGAGYSYINKSRNEVKSLNYVFNPNVAVSKNADPIFKRNDLLVYGGVYRDFEFVKMLRNTKDGATGYGVVAENNDLLSVAYQTMMFELMLVKNGGQKKGFLKAASKLSSDAVTSLKAAWNNLYRNNNGDNVVILNNGLEFQEANNSSVEMQINQNKITNGNEIMQIFGVPVELLNGKATGGNEILYDSFVKLSILPILKTFETALNRDLLLASEKDAFCFEFDVKDLLKGDIEKRFKAYEIAVKNGILQVDEVRNIENYESLGLDFIKLGLADVLYNPTTKEIYTPNTNSLVKMGEQGQEPTNGQVTDPNDPADPNDPNNAADGENPPAQKIDPSNDKGVKNNESGNS